MRRRRAASNSPASLLRRFGSSTVARFVLISRCARGSRSLSLSAVFFGSCLFISGLRRPLSVSLAHILEAPHFVALASRILPHPVATEISNLLATSQPNPPHSATPAPISV